MSASCRNQLSVEYEVADAMLDSVDARSIKEDTVQDHEDR